MVKLVDPSLPFANVVALHRREQPQPPPPPSGWWTSTHDWRVVYPEPTAVAGIGASEMALRDFAVALTQTTHRRQRRPARRSRVPGVPVGAISNGMLPPSLLLWVAGETTTQRESEQLSSFGVPGVWIGSEAEAGTGWACIEPRVFGDRAQFVRQFVAVVASLVEVPEAAYVSNNLSNEPRRTDQDDDGRRADRNVADLHEHGRRRTTTDPPGGQTAGS